MAGYFSKERREQRRRDREARRQDKDRVRVAKLRLRESKQAAALADTRRRLTPLAAAGAPERPPRESRFGTYGMPVDSMRECDTPHRDPSHHVGPCDAACRAGNTVHYHRR